ncbi:MAG: DUF2306 domain-containing protein [Hamadaea sp.]|nr:DUF2306 domain-containing protein [Hamadaea sp.]NUR51004.1 DUF2306 domain-containing protein [Hamadaea sp.]NUT04373.1 DUF2306 domain-containing protein [Hamadaea sp.]
MTSSRKPQWIVPGGLILLSLVPVIAAFVRGAELASRPEVTPDNARFVTAPVPIMLHIVGSVLFAVLGALQFAPGLRRRRWHRYAGRLVLPSGIAVAVSGLWMTLTYALPPIEDSGLSVIRVFVSTGMLFCLVLGFVAVRRRDFMTHRAWMMRAYALALGAGTQAFTFAFWTVAVGEPGVLAYALLMLAAWLINLTVAEWFIRRGGEPRRRAGLSGPGRAGADVSGGAVPGPPAPRSTASRG